MQDQAFDYDVAILGGGSAGYAAARTAADQGLRTVVLEGGEAVGGLCILRGCMPTKALLFAAEVAQLARHARTWGIEAGPVEVHFSEVMARKRRLIGEFAAYRRGQLEESKGFDFVRAAGRFVDPHTLRLSTGGTLRARKFVLSTGSQVAPPPLPALAALGCLTSDEALALERLPGSLIVLGAGPVAVEFAQFFARMGSEVTIVQRSSQILRGLDEDAARAVEQSLTAEGIRLYTDTRLVDAQRQGDGKQLCFEHEGEVKTLVAGEVLMALGRRPNTAELGLDRAGVETRDGRILADTRQQTSAAHIYAAGDCTGPHEIVHLAIQQGEVAAYNLSEPQTPREMDYRLLTQVVFTDPQAAAVGLTERELAELDRPYRAASYPFNDHGKSMIMGSGFGFVKLLADPRTGEILGGSCVGPVGGELIHEVVVAMAARMTVHEFARVPHYHPTLAEIWTYPAEELAGQIPPP